MPRTAETPVGAPGTVTEDVGVALAVLDAVPVPTALIAETLKLYAEELVSPVTVVAAVVDVPSENVVQLESVESLYSMR